VQLNVAVELTVGKKAGQKLTVAIIPGMGCANLKLLHLFSVMYNSDLLCGR